MTPIDIFDAARAACALKAVGRRVLAIQDTSHLAFPGRPLGPGGDGEVPALFLHPVIAIDADDGTALGLAGGRVWTRDRDKLVVGPTHTRALADKESVRWLEEGQRAKETLAAARSVTLIADRESDIYEEWVRLPYAGDGASGDRDGDGAPRFDVLTRASVDRCLDGGGMLFAAASAWPEAGRRVIAITARASREARKATLVLKHGTVTITKPKKGKSKGLPKSVTLCLVEVAEAGAPSGVEPVHWRLLTTRPVVDAAAAWQVVEDYRQRWRIEEYFRIVKRSGLDLEAARLESATALINLVAMGALAAVPVMQLVEGRDAGPERQATEVIGPELIALAIALSRTLEGSTQKQRNPHQEGSLAWLSWIIARLGGWSGYTRYGPAGPKTIAVGWAHFNAMQQGWTLRGNV